ncbi:LysR family transcriptional regulator [Gordonia sp. DT219]|uniref:LysR family transcriptional regulator n=1 Tax=Gordonia sp. DT219 TaxID=3416658 RepID=UPI003CF3696A
MIDLKRMMLLCDLAELGTVTAVAERRHITSSAVSQQLRVLEEESSAVLFRRDGRTLGLTRSGEVLADHARRVLGALDEAMSAVAATVDRASGQLVVASFNMGISLLVAPMMQRLAEDAPDVRVLIQQENRARALRLLRQGETDLAITCAYGFGGHESQSGLMTVPLIDEPLVLMAPPRLHVAIRTRGLSTLADEQWVSGTADSGLGIAVMRAGERSGFIPRITHRLVGARNICDVAGTGIGPAVVPLLTVPEHLRPLVVDDVTLETRQIQAVVRAGRQRDPKTAIALRALQLISEGALRATRTPIGLAG